MITYNKLLILLNLDNKKNPLAKKGIAIKYSNY